MHDGLRRFIILGIVFAIAMAGLYGWRASGKAGDGYGLFDLLSGRRPMTRKENYTLERLPKLNLEDVPYAARLNEDSKRLAAAVLPSVVSINTATVVNQPVLRRTLFGGTSVYNRQILEPGLGSGVIATAEGHIVTNYHVVQRASQIQVTLDDDRKYPAQVIGTDPKTDVAVLKIVTKDEDETFPALRFTPDSDLVSVGEMVFAVGNPFGLSGTVTRGIISAKERRFSDNAADLFQTDTVINPGNSGGPLVNLNGDIVGLNVAIYSGEKQTGLWQGVGLAIAANDVRDSFESIVDEGRPVYGYLGVQVANPRSRGGEAGSNPVVVAGVEKDSPAERAGLKVGDVIKTFGDRKLRSFTELKRLVRRSLGKEVDMEIERDGQEETLTVEIAEFDEGAVLRRAMQRKAAFSDALAYLDKTLGIRVRDLTPEQKQQLGAGRTQGGVFVTEVRRNTQAELRLRPGDLIRHCDGVEFGSAEQFAQLLDALPDRGRVSLYVSRRNPYSGRWYPILVLLDALPSDK